MSVENATTNGGARLLTAEDLAQRWKVKTAHIHRLAREGQLPCVRLGRYQRFTVEAIQEFERAGGTNGNHEGEQ